MKTSDAINEIAAASAKAQAAMRPAIKDATNPAYRSKYADLAAVWEACRGPLTGNGITVWQDVTSEENGIAVTTRLVHSSGQWVEFGPLTVPLAKRDAHGVGSATSYGKRYALAAAIGVIAEEDDDGNAAVGHSRGNGRAEAPPVHPPMPSHAEAITKWLNGDQVEKAAQLFASLTKDEKRIAWKDLSAAHRERIKVFQPRESKQTEVVQ